MNNLLHYNKELVVIISVFGSSCDRALKQYLRLIDCIKQCIPSNSDIRIVLSSRTIINKLEKLGYYYHTLSEQLAIVDRLGYKKVLVVSINLFPTSEHEYIVNVVNSFKKFSPVKYEITLPFFTLADQINRFFSYLDNKIRLNYSEYVILYIAHGSNNLDIIGSQSYLYLRDYLKLLNFRNYFYTIEGIYSFKKDLFMDEIKSIGKINYDYSKLLIVPLLLVNGSHYNNDIEEIKNDLKLEFNCVITPEDLFKVDKFSLLELDETINYFKSQVDEGILRLNW